MAINSVNIDILKKYLDDATLKKVTEEEAEIRSNSFKYVVNVLSDPRYPKKRYIQLRGTIGYAKNKKKLWAHHYLGPVQDLSLINKDALCLKHKNLMKSKAKDAILKELLA